jgi:GNAT superfamily N-acetyltransferase
VLEGFTIQPLARHHDRGRFACGNDELDTYLKQFARKQDENNTTRLHVYANAEGEIAGYYTLSAMSIELTGLPDAMQRGRSHLPVPATLLGRLARHEKYKAGGLGPFLLSHASRDAFEASRTVASAFLVVDSKPHAVKFYVQAGFVPCPWDDMRLVLPMETIGRELSRLS